MRYSADVSSDELVVEMKHLKAIHDANFGSNPIEPIMLLNKISQFHLDDVFSNVAVALRIFCTIPVTVASAERSFSKLAQIQNFLRSTMLQTRLTNLASLSLESDLSKKVSSRMLLTLLQYRKLAKISSQLSATATFTASLESLD